jgi:hypothetical protein
MKFQHALSIIIPLILTACGSGEEKLSLPGNPLVFQLEKPTADGVFATYAGGSVTREQILDQNPVEADLHVQETLIRLEAVLTKFAADPKAAGANLDIFMDPPKKSAADLAKTWGLTIPNKAKINFKSTPPDKDVVAQWGDNQVKASEVDATSVRLALVKTRAFRENLNRLTGIVIRHSLLEAAKNEKMEINEYVHKHIAPSETPLTDAEFKEFLSARNIKPGDVNPDQEKSLHDIAFESRKTEAVENYVVKNLLSGPVHVHEFPPSFKVQVPDGWSTIWGVNDAPVNVLYFGDFVCGPCRDALSEVVQAANQFKGHVKVGFDFLFSPSDRESRMISEAALCVQAQGTPHFRKFAELYASNPPGAEEAEIEKAARDSGVNVELYKKCFLSRAHQALLNQHLEFATKVGVTSQPTILVDGEPLAGAISASELNDVILRKVHAKSSVIGALWRRFKAMF